MCGRYTVTFPLELVARLIDGLRDDDVDVGDLSVLDPSGPRFNVAPSQRVPIVAMHRGRVRLGTAIWGFRPAEPGAGTKPRINARRESLATSPAYREELAAGRCLLPADGFFEWQTVAGSKQKQAWYLHAKDRVPFAFAGLFTPARRDSPATCAIITMPPCPVVAAIHDRMPAILDPEAARGWLRDPVPAALRTLERLPRAAVRREDMLEAHRVSSRVSDPRLDEPSLIEPA